MSSVNSLAIGDADSAIVIEGGEQTLRSASAQNKKRVTDLKSSENCRGDSLEGFGELNFLVATDAARVVGTLRSALGVIFTEVTLRPHHLHRGPLLFEYRCDVQERVRIKSAEFGLVRLQQEERWGSNGFKGTGHPCAGRKLTRLFGPCVSHPVVRIEWVFFSMGEDNGGFKLTDGRGQPLDRRPI